MAMALKAQQGLRAKRLPSNLKSKRRCDGKK